MAVEQANPKDDRSTSALRLGLIARLRSVADVFDKYSDCATGEPELVRLIECVCGTSELMREAADHLDRVSPATPGVYSAGGSDAVGGTVSPATQDGAVAGVLVSSGADASAVHAGDGAARSVAIGGDRVSPVRSEGIEPQTKEDVLTRSGEPVTPPSSVHAARGEGNS